MRQPEGIILAFSNIRDDNLKHLNPELQKIRDVLKEAEEKNYLDIIEHNGVTYNSLSYLLNSGKGRKATMLHFFGHSSKSGLLVQSHDEHGIISKKPLTNLIKAHKGFRFIFLNSCYSEDIAQELINAGVPYVIGTTDKVNDGQSAIVAAKFYMLLAKWGKTIEEAFLLTKDYVDDPLNDNDTNIKEAFRTFSILDDTKNEYPWQLYQSPGLTEKDRHWVLNPDQGKAKKRKLYITLATAGVILIIATLIIAFGIATKKGTDKKRYENAYNDSISIARKDSIRKDSINKIKIVNPPRPSHPNEKKIPLVVASANKLFAELRVLDSANKYNNDITTRVRRIFLERGYMIGEAGANLPAGSYNNIISGEFTLSPPVKKDGPFNTFTLNYTVRLTLRFSDGTGKQICGQRDYSTKVSSTESDTKERILQQGLNDILDQIQKDTDFPFCIKK